MKALLPALLVAAMAATAARAECTAPNNDVKIPDGNTATMDDMLAAKRAIQENNAQVETYTQCLKTEQDAKIAAGGSDMKDEQKTKIATEYTNRQNVEVEKLQKLADRFNLEVRNYKAKHAADAAASPPATKDAPTAPAR